MADDLPDPIQKRDLVYEDEVDEDQKRKTGDQFLEEGYLVDALDAYEEAGYREGGEQILEQAIQQGNYFLVSRIRGTWPEMVDNTKLEQAAENAEENGRYVDAIKLYNTSGNSSRADSLEEKLESDLDINIPEVVRKDIADAKEKDEVDG